MTDLEQKQDLEAQTLIAKDGNTYWGVVWAQPDHALQIAYTGLFTKEAAEVARRILVGQLLDNGQLYGPSEVPIHYFNRMGACVQALKQIEVPDDSERLANIVAKVLAVADVDTDVPFHDLDVLLPWEQNEGSAP